jgi:hypothetical protein
MNKVKFLLFVTSIAVLMSCDIKDVKLYPSFTHNAEVIVNHEGNYIEFIDIQVSEIKDAMAGLDTEGGITDVMIEGIILDVTKNAAIGSPDNSASSITSNIVLTGWDGVEYILIENLSINLDQDTQEINLQSSLRKAGIKQFRDILFAIAQNSIPSGKEKVGIRLTGTPTPANAYINAKLEIRIKVVVEYSTEL